MTTAGAAARTRAPLVPPLPLPLPLPGFRCRPAPFRLILPILLLHALLGADDAEAAASSTPPVATGTAFAHLNLPRPPRGGGVGTGVTILPSRRQLPVGGEARTWRRRRPTVIDLPAGIITTTAKDSATGHNSALYLSSGSSDNEEEDDEEMVKARNDARIKVWSNRRKQIRSTLRSAESLRYYRITNGLGVKEEDDEDGGGSTKSALAVTAFFVAMGAVALRVGGRAALVSGLGLNFATDNPELQTQMNSVLDYADSLGPILEPALFVAAWTAVKVLCFDAGGVVLALASGILFGGVIQGALFSAFAATVGSSVAFGLAKLDTPVRKKALELLEEYPSLRGIERVVARDGVKAVLTLRLAPVLPIPIGMYNYVYGVTNVPFWDFAIGIFIGSIKPYLLDSYLGYFGKTVVDGTVGEGGIEDIILLAALGVSVLIGVFASQLAGETWEAVQREVEAEKDEKSGGEDGTTEKDDDGIVRKVMGIDVPDFLVGMQLSFRAADERLTSVVDAECAAKVWNLTKEEGQTPPENMDPARWPSSPEVADDGKFDFVQAISEGFVFSPVLFRTFLRYADPVFSDEEEQERLRGLVAAGEPPTVKPTPSTSSTGAGQEVSAAVPTPADLSAREFVIDSNASDKDLLRVLQALRAATEERIEQIDEEMKKK